MDKREFANLVVGDRVAFGTYPQDSVTDAGVIAAIRKITGKPPFGKKGKWIDYCYTRGKIIYADTVYEGKRYRSVYIKRHRDRFIREFSDYQARKIYVFSYESIMWQVVAVEDGKALLVSERVIDQNEYYHSDKNRTIDGVTVYANNYKHSDIRKWLNGKFLNTAFSDEERELIEFTTVRNDASTTQKPENKFACEDTVDKVFLLSFQEAKNLFPDNRARWRKATEYAKSQGCVVYKTPDEKYNNTSWCLRSPKHNYNLGVRGVGDGGGLGDGGFSTSNLNRCDGEVVPAIVVPLK